MGGHYQHNRGESRMLTGNRVVSPVRRNNFIQWDVPYYTVTLLLFITVLAHHNASAYNTTFLQYDIHGECWQYITHDGGKIFSHPGHGRYADNTDCKVTITTSPGKRIHAVFESFDVTDSVNCYQDEVIVYDGRFYSSLMLSGAPYGLCGTDLAPRYHEMESTGNELTVRFITDNVVSSNKGFSVVFTSFVPEETRTANDKCFSCADGSMCIDSDLKCDSLWNCADGSDESFTLCSVVPTELPGASTGWLGWMGTFLAVTVAAIIVIFLLVSLMVCCCCKRKGQGMPVGRGQADGRGAVSTSVPSSSSSSNSSSNSSPNYGEMSVRTPPREVYQPTVIDNMSGAGGSHVFYGYPPPSGRADLGGGIYGFQGGYFPMRKENLCHTVERGFNNGHNY
ncbi:uncharacterized protein [Asterias amurensis]|uniref:uncharacterized protein n=1 Tax=Asterias amurensis TaxID=7602 RepID=UPI003AB1FC5F